MPRKKKGGRGAQKRVVKVRMADGASYEGQVDRNRAPNGEGVQTYPNGIRFEGTFVAGKQERHAVVTNRDGDRYDGKYVDDKMEGHGVYVFANGGRYDGQYVDGKREGHGVYVRADGNRFDGQYVGDKREGWGTFTFGEDNASWEGTWSCSSAVGIGTWHFDCDGPAGGGTGQLHFSGDGPTGAEMFASAAPAKWAQLATETEISA